MEVRLKEGRESGAELIVLGVEEEVECDGGV